MPPLMEMNADVSRIAEDAPSIQLSATLILRPMAYLCVEIFFHQEPIADLEVKFSKIGADNQAGNQIGETQHTDKLGIAKLDFMVPVGNYICQIEHQNPATISTVDALTDPFVLVLPIGRPYFDFEGDHEFYHE